MKKIIAAVLGLLMMAGLVFAEPALGAGKTAGAGPQQHRNQKHHWKKWAKRHHKAKHKRKHWNKRHHKHN